jgi:hypothetical protein
MDKIRTIDFPAGMQLAWVVLPSVQSIMLFKPKTKPKLFNSGIMKDDVSGFGIRFG